MSDIIIGASTISGFQPSAIGADLALTGVSVTNGSPNVTGVNFLPPSVVGLSGLKITFSTGITYTVATVTSRSALTLTANYNESTTTVTGTLHKFVHLRVYVLTPFTPFGESFVAQSGAPGSAAWFRRYAVPIINDGSQNVAHIPQITLPATTNSSEPTARYYAALHTQSGGFIQEFPGCVSEWGLDSTTTPTSWPQICTFNDPPNPAPPLPVNFYTAAQIDTRFPSGLANQLLYFKNTGNVLHTLTLDTAFTITGDTLFLTGPSGVNRIQEEGVNLPQRQTVNIVGTTLTATDDVPNSRTNITSDPDVDALASNSTNGLWTRTGAGTGAARTLQQPAAGITITNPAGTAGDPTFALANDLAAVEGLGTNGLATRTAANTWTTRTITGTANRIVVTNGDGVAGNPTLDIGSTVATSGNSLNFFAATTSAQLAGVISDETGSGLLVFNTSPRIVTAILDTNGNELVNLTATGSAVNEITLANAAAGSSPAISLTGSSTDIDLTVTPKGAGKLGVGTPGGSPVAGIVGGPDASGTNTAGVNINLHAGRATGTGIPGHVAVRYPRITTTGTTLQALSTSSYPVVTSLYTNTSQGTAINSTIVETSLFTGLSASTGSTTSIEAGISRAGTLYKISVFGSLQTTGTPTLQIQAKFGATQVFNTGVATMATVNGRFWLDIDLLVTVIGATGSVTGFGRLEYSSVTAGAATISKNVGANVTVIDFTAAQALDVTATWGTSSASNSITVLGMIITRVR